MAAEEAGLSITSLVASGWPHGRAYTRSLATLEPRGDAVTSPRGQGLGGLANGQLHAGGLEQRAGRGNGRPHRVRILADQRRGIGTVHQQ
jgi:hypothetical protein